MSVKRGMRAQYDFMSLPALRGGLTALSEKDRVGLADLFVKEVRKGSFKPAGNTDDEIRKVFLEHVQASFVESGDVQAVIDFQPRLVATARSLVGLAHPIESLILYATWVEHWLNATLLTTALRRGLSEAEAIQLVRQGVETKLASIWRLLELPTIPDDHIRKLKALAEVRNEHVHYKWKGQDPDVLFSPGARLSLALADVDDLVRSLVLFELDELLATDIAVANRLFQVNLKPFLILRALEWKSPSNPYDASSPCK